MAASFSPARFIATGSGTTVRHLAEAHQAVEEGAGFARRQDSRIICFPFAGGLVGGSHISALKLIQSLDHAHFKPLVLLHSKEGALAMLLRAEGIAAELAPTSSYLEPGAPRSFADLPRLAADLVRMGRFLRERQVAIVHTNDGPMHATWTLPSRLAGARHIWHHRGNPRAAGLRFLAPLLATRVLAVSDFAAPSRGILSARRKCSVIYSPFDPAIAQTDRGAGRAALLHAIAVPPETRIFGFIGHFVSRKRPLVFLETIAELRRARPGMPLAALMFGEALEPGLEEKVRARRRALGLEDVVHMMGFRQPIEPWLAGLDALLVPAVEEPFGRTLIEAMLVGTPVIAAASGGNIEAIRDRETGLLGQAEAPAALAALVLELIDRPFMAEAIATRARQEALVRFGIARHVEQVSQVYREVLAK